MRVPTHHHRHPSGDRIDIKVVHRMHQIKQSPCKLHDIGARKLPTSARYIHIAPNRGHRSDLSQLIQYLVPPNISGVQNMLDLSQSHQSLRPQ